MSAKKVAFGTQPATKSAPSADQWVESRVDEATKRLTIDLPEGLHRRVKMECARRGTKMADEIRKLLEANFPER